MVQKIRTCVIVILTIIDFIGIISIFISLSMYKENHLYYRKKFNEISKNNTHLEENYMNAHFNNIGTKEKIKFKEIIKKNNNYNNNLKLSYHSSFYYDSILLLNVLFLFFLFHLLISFIVGDNECCNCCQRGCNNNSNCDCNCNNSQGNGGVELIVWIIIICIVFIIYFLTKLCGKHLARYISLYFISFINFLIFFISVISIGEGGINIIINIIISLILFLCNLLGTILPNLKKCENLRYKYISRPPVIHYPQHTQLYQNNNIIVSNNLQSTGNITNYPVPIVNNEYSVNQQIQNSISSSINNSSIDSGNLSNQKIINNEDMGIPPLPNQVLPSEQEIYSTSSKM